MSPNILEAFAGKADKSDVLIKCFRRDGQGVKVFVKSSVAAFFGKQIEKAVIEKLQALHITDVEVHIEDDGALPLVLMARLEAVLMKMGYKIEENLFDNICHCHFNPQPKRLRRTRLYIPGGSPDLMVNAGLFGADCIILDLEDSVAPEFKYDTRFVVRNTLLSKHNFFGTSERIVRINPLGCEFGYNDLEMIVPARPDTILIPKCESADDIVKIERIVEQLEQRNEIEKQILFMPLIETAKGVLNAQAIATASKRNIALCFGAEDFTRDIGVERTRDGAETLNARCTIVYAAKAAGIDAIDTVFSDVDDDAGLRASMKEAVTLGFAGKGVIHPGQIKIIHEVLTPTPEQIEYANKVMNAIETAKAQGRGVISLGSKMIDAPVVERAKRTLELARQMGIDTMKKEVSA
ncbi:MAG TPA: aldolase/citrate lyase family protein [Candidatus Wallbacteria bacterium]|nr:aldolase/citrate lyase family protein [Candidatus Wallbacteria bacterium]